MRQYKKYMLNNKAAMQRAIYNKTEETISCSKIREIGLRLNGCDKKIKENIEDIMKYML